MGEEPASSSVLPDPVIPPPSPLARTNTAENEAGGGSGRAGGDQPDCSMWTLSAGSQLVSGDEEPGGRLVEGSYS